MGKARPALKLGHSSSVRKIMVRFILLYVIFPLILTFFLFFWYNESLLVENASESYQQILSGIGYNLDTTAQSMINAIKYISLDQNVCRILLKNYANEYMDVDDSYQIEKMLVNLQLQYLDYYFQINIFSNNRMRVSSNTSSTSNFGIRNLAKQNYADYDWYARAISSRGINIWTTSPITSSGSLNSAEASAKQIMVSTAVIDYNTFEASGVVTIAMPIDWFAKRVFASQKKENAIIFVLNDKNELILSSGAGADSIISNELLASLPQLTSGKYSYMTVNKTKYLVNSFFSEKLNWSLVQLVPYNQIVSNVRMLTKNIFIVVIAIFCILIAITVKFSNNLTYPIKQLVGEMEKVQQSERLAIKFLDSKGASDEIRILEQTFNTMVAKQKELIDTLTAKEKRQNELKLEMLMAQINPHFLFNTLNVIKWSALMSNATNVATMIANLGNILEMSINRKNDFITVQEEIKILESYFFIQIIRLSYTVELECRIAEDTKQCIMPKLILQPLVENAILHAFTEGMTGTITVISQKTGSELQLIVIDNGMGIDPSVLGQIQNSLENHEHRHLSGIGIENVDERIKLHYGERYGISLHLNEAGGTTVNVILPLEESEENK